MTGQKLLFIDYDDTLLASYMMEQLCKEHGVKFPMQLELTDEVKSILLETETIILELFSNMEKADIEIVILSNAVPGWVQLSCRTFYPTLWEKIQSWPIVSARFFEKQHGLNPIMWKYEAMQTYFDNEINIDQTTRPEYIDQCFESRNHYISWGDSIFEREALWMYKSRYKGIFKTLKFVEKPSFRQLLAQWKFLTHVWSHIIDHEQDMDLNLNVNSLDRCT